MIPSLNFDLLLMDCVTLSKLFILQTPVFSFAKLKWKIGGDILNKMHGLCG